jgi:hypothetical protein
MPDLHDAFEGLRNELQSVEAPDLLHEALRRAPSVSPPEPRTPWKRLGTVGAALAIAIASTLFVVRAFDHTQAPASDAPRLPYQLAYTGAEVPDPHWTQGQLWLIDQSGHRIVLSADPGDGVTPAWSPDGSQIAFDAEFHGSDQIWVVNADGSDLHQVTNMFPMNGDAINDSPAWSPDGTQIAYNCWDGRQFHELCLINADGSHPQKLTNGVNTNHDTPPIWLDADELMFAGTVYSDPQPCSNGETCWGPGGSGTYVIRTDGTGLKRVGTSRLQMTPSPDGRTVAFACPTKAGNAICVETTLLTDRRQITQPPSALPSVEDSDAFPAWLPDGRLSFVRSSELSGFDGYHLYIVDSTGGTPTEVTNLGEDVRGLAWGPASALGDSTTTSPEPPVTTTQSPSITSVAAVHLGEMVRLDLGLDYGLSSMAEGFDSLWVIGQFEEPGVNQLRRVDPISGSVEAKFSLPVDGGGEWGGDGLAIGDGYVWATAWDSATIFRIDPSDNAVSKFPLDGRVVSEVAVDQVTGDLWAAVAGVDGQSWSLVNLDPSDGSVLSSTSYMTDWSGGLLPLNGSVWQLNRNVKHGGVSGGSLHQIVPGSAHDVQTGGSFALPVTDGHWIWTAASGDTEVMNLAGGIAQVDSSGRVMNTWDVGNVGYDVAIGDDHGVWFLGAKGLERLNPSTGELQAWKPTENGDTPIFVVAGFDGVWVGAYEGSLYFRAFA